MPIHLRLHEIDRALPDGREVPAYRVQWRSAVWTRHFEDLFRFWQRNPLGLRDTPIVLN